MQGILEHKDHSLNFSGHETFPLRQTWLKKIVGIAEKQLIDKKKFTDPLLLAELGVGKNMLSSMKYWATVCGVIAEYDKSNFCVTDLGSKLFSDDGLDPYSESLTTTWLLHWMVASRGHRATTIYFLFNKLNSHKFRKKDLVLGLEDLIESKNKKISATTLGHDIDTILRSYAVKLGKEVINPEDLTEPIFGELSLINQEEDGDFSFNRGYKESLNEFLFAFCLLDFWEQSQSFANTLSLDRIAYEEGSPGRVFKLDENSVIEKLLSLEELSGGKIIWSNIAGIKQVVRKGADFTEGKYNLLKRAYE